MKSHFLLLSCFVHLHFHVTMFLLYKVILCTHPFRSLLLLPVSSSSLLCQQPFLLSSKGFNYLWALCTFSTDGPLWRWKWKLQMSLELFGSVKLLCWDHLSSCSSLWIIHSWYSTKYTSTQTYCSLWLFLCVFMAPMQSVQGRKEPVCCVCVCVFSYSTTSTDVKQRAVS